MECSPDVSVFVLFRGRYELSRRCTALDRIRILDDIIEYANTSALVVCCIGSVCVPSLRWLAGSAWCQLPLPTSLIRVASGAVTVSCVECLLLWSA